MYTQYTDNEALPWEEDSKPKKKKKKTSHPLLIGLVLLAIVLLWIIFILMTVQTTTVNDETVPQVVSVEQIDSYPISQYEIDEETLEVNYEDRLELDFSNIGYEYKVTLDNGKEIIMHPGSRNSDIGSTRALVELNGYIYLNDRGEITINDDGTVDITVSAKIRNTTMKHNPILTDAEFTFKKEIADCIVKSIKYKSKAPVDTYKDNDYEVIEDCEFEITYNDGRKVTAKPETSESGMYQTLDGHCLNVYEYDDNEDGNIEGLGVSILDCSESCIIPIKEKEFPFSAVEITDCSFDESYCITSISYKVTYKDGTTAEFNNQKRAPEAERNWVLRYGDNFSFPHNKGYYVLAKPTFIYSEEDIPEGADDFEFSEKAAINVELSLGFISDNGIKTNKVFAVPESDCECLCHNNDKTAKRFYETIKPVMEFLSLKEYCTCGVYHYELSSF